MILYARERLSKVPFHSNNVDTYKTAIAQSLIDWSEAIEHQKLNVRDIDIASGQLDADVKG